MLKKIWASFWPFAILLVLGFFIMLQLGLSARRSALFAPVGAGIYLVLSLFPTRKRRDGSEY